jgi:hypothetical protein
MAIKLFEGKSKASLVQVWPKSLVLSLSSTGFITTANL